MLLVFNTVLSMYEINDIYVRTPQVATFPVEPFGTQSPSKFQHFTFLGQKLTDVPIWSTFLVLILI